VILPAGSAPSGDGRSGTVVTIVVALLCVVGLLVATLTWRYWWFTDPRRGYVRSRAVLARGATLDEAEGELVRVWHPDEQPGPTDRTGTIPAQVADGNRPAGRRPGPPPARAPRSEAAGARRGRVR
jgi:hypothetical protein